MSRESTISLICGKKVFDEIMALKNKPEITDSNIWYREDHDEYRIFMKAKWDEESDAGVKRIMNIIRDYTNRLESPHEEGVSFIRLGPTLDDNEELSNGALTIEQSVDMRIWTTAWFNKRLCEMK